MATRPGIAVTFVGLGADEKPPAIALYRIDTKSGTPEKLARAEGDRLGVDPARLKGQTVAIGPDVEDPKSLDTAALLRFRADQVIADWAQRGLVIPANRWRNFLSHWVCVSGRVRKCRPWWYDLVVSERIRPLAPLRAAKLGVRSNSLAALTLDPSIAIHKLPYNCQPLCDGIVEVFERVCCCHRRIVWADLVDRLRDALVDVPVLVDDPNPPDPIGPISDFRRKVRQVSGSINALARGPAPLGGGGLDRTIPAERVYHDYQALLRTPADQVDAFVDARPYLSAYVCHCRMRKVGETPIGPGGEFDFCYRQPLHLHSVALRCYTTYAYRVKQLIGGSWTVVYDGVAGHDYFAAGETAVLTTSNPAARPCGDGPPPPDTGDGTPFVMLEHVTGAGTHHFNFPAQTGVSTVGALPAGSSFGLYDFGLPDCPWATTLGLRLWADQPLDGIVVYYRLKVVPVNAAGAAVGTPTILDTPVAWSRYVDIPGDVITTSVGLAANPADVGGQEGLFVMPYWSYPDRRWLSGQYHQLWDTTKFANGKYLLILELFGPGGARIKPAATPDVPGPGAEAPFQFRVWEAPDNTRNVPFADCAHVFWIDNTPVVGDIANLRKGGAPSSDECQFMSGPAGTTFSAGFQAYHVNGVTTGGGPGDSNSFMAGYSLTWQRGLNGPYGTLEAGTADKGELGVAGSNTLPFGTLLGPFWSPPAPPSPVPPDGFTPPTWPAQSKCSFSIHLHVNAKHHNGGAFIDAYDYHETASFALEVTPP